MMFLNPYSAVIFTVLFMVFVVGIIPICVGAAQMDDAGHRGVAIIVTTIYLFGGIGILDAIAIILP
jgi:hypothetical protein